MRITVAAAVVLLASSLGYAQTLSFGLTAGVPLKHIATSNGGYAAAAGHYAFGPTVRVDLPHRFGVDADLLYKSFVFGIASDPARARVHRLELPLMLRYGIPGIRAHPFVHAGMSFNRVIAITGGSLCARTALGEKVYCVGDTEAAVLRHPHTHGPLLGFGIQVGLGPFQLTPELRITRWIDRNFGTQTSPLRSNLTGIDLLCGIRF